MSAAEPGRLWGWNKLDPQTARRIVAAAGIRPGDLVLDLGAGTGALTGALLRAGARVVAVELHRGRVGVLQSRFAGKGVEVRTADICRLRYPDEPFRVVANPPWAVADTIRHNLQRTPRLVQADLVVPRWLARRWAAADRRITVGASVRAESFHPSAPTGASVAVIRPEGRQRRS